MTEQPGGFFERNKAWITPGEHNYNTDLGAQEPAFQAWVKQNNVPFDPNAAAPADYDMRGFYKALQAGDPKAKEAVNPNDQKMHFPDYWKTPYHQSFSAESQWADPQKAPSWNEKDQLITPQGQVVYDEKKEAVMRMLRTLAERISLMQQLKAAKAGGGQ